MELPTTRVADIEAAGWKRRDAGPFMEIIGPLWGRRDKDRWIYGLIAEDRHMNPAKVVHGGLLQSLLDHVLSAIAWEAVGRNPCVTVQTDSQFLAAVKSNDFIVARGIETHRTKHLIFMRGHLEVNEKKVLSAQSIFKIIRQPSAHPHPASSCLDGAR